MPETARRKGKGKEERSASSASERIKVCIGCGAYRTERLRGARGRGEVEELGDGEGREGIGCALWHDQYYFCLQM